MAIFKETVVRAGAAALATATSTSPQSAAAASVFPITTPSVAAVRGRVQAALLHYNWRMKKALSIAALLILSGAIASSAAASLRWYTVGTKSVKGVGTVGSFKGTVQKPYKILLYCEGTKARCGANVQCFRGTKELDWNRSDLGPYTWNLKRKSWKGLDSCQFTATIKSGFTNARVTVQAMARP